MEITDVSRVKNCFSVLNFVFERRKRKYIIDADVIDPKIIEKNNCAIGITACPSGSVGGLIWIAEKKNNSIVLNKKSIEMIVFDKIIVQLVLYK